MKGNNYKDLFRKTYEAQFPNATYKPLVDDSGEPTLMSPFQRMDYIGKKAQIDQKDVIGETLNDVDEEIFDREDFSDVQVPLK